MAASTTSDPALVSPAVQDYPRPSYAWYVVGVLTLLYVFSFIDRYILALLVEPMKRDLAINDTQMSLLMGFSFAVFYCLFGLPLGRLADSRRRTVIIAAGCFVWSLMTAACGLARNYWHLLLLRMGVGIGEATLSPAAYSLITDYFPKERLATALSVYTTAIHIGTGFAFIFGGAVVAFVGSESSMTLPIVGSLRPWQTVFFIVGVPGLALVLLMRTVREPARRALNRARTSVASSAAASIPLGEVWCYFAANKGTLLCHCLGFTLSSLTSYTTWGPTLFIRNYGWSAAEAGIVSGLLMSTVGVLGILAGGHFADHLARRGYADANMRLGLIATLAWFPTGILFPLMPTGLSAVALLIPTYFMVSAPWGAAAAALQQVVPDRMRGQAAAVYLLAVNLIGLGVGPTAVALLTDFVFEDDSALNLSLLIVGTVSHIAAALLLWKGLRFFRESLERLRLWNLANQ